MPCLLSLVVGSFVFVCYVSGSSPEASVCIMLEDKETELLFTETSQAEQVTIVPYH